MLGLPAASLGPAVVGLDDLLGPLASELRERLAGVPDWRTRFAVLDGALIRRTGQLPDVAPEVGRAWDRFTGSHGAPRVADVAAEVGWSRRHLGERFLTEYGVTPKDAVRLARFDRSRWLIGGRRVRTLAEAAAAAGYYDQSHLTRDWRDFAGCPPSAWLVAEELPSVQDGEVAHRAQ